MKAVFAIQSKHKIAITLLMMAVMILIGVLLERSYFKDINKASVSIYKDRLIPATSMFYLADHIAQRRLIMESFLHHEAAPAIEIPARLQVHRQAMDSVIIAFEKTYLVDREEGSLLRLKENVASYTRAEMELLNEATEGGGADLENLRSEYEEIRAELRQLSGIQATVGLALMDDTEKTVARAYGVSNLQLIILVIICIVAQIFILASKSITSPVKQDHKWN